MSVVIIENTLKMHLYFDPTKCQGALCLFDSPLQIREKRGVSVMSCIFTAQIILL